MRLSRVGRLGVVGVVLVLSVTAYAQDAAVSGSITDATGGVLPGVTITAVHEATGNTFVAVTGERGGFRIPVRTGIYRLTVELPGFATVTRSGLEVLVGQQVVINLQLAPATVQESVTVTGEAPLIDLTQSSLGSNVDPRQMSELPVLGRNWMSLTLLAPGARTNDVGATPVDVRGATGNFQLNLDGQQVTQIHAYGQGQPQLSRDSIAEFEFIANRFDATQGRSTGVQVNAITKSGTNTPAGSFSGYFRHDSLNAADFVARRVLPYSNQQLSATFGVELRDSPRSLRLLRAGGDGPAPPGSLQRNLGRRIRLPAERAVFLRLGLSVQHDLRRRSAGNRGNRPSCAPGRLHRAAHQPGWKSAPPCGRAGPAAIFIRRADGRRRYRGSVQRVRSRELRFLHDGRKQREVRRADEQHRHRVSATDGSARIPSHVLNRFSL